MIDIMSLEHKELKKLLEERGVKSYRADQIYDWLYKKKTSEFSDMTTLSKELRESLRMNFTFPVLELIDKQISHDSTEKYLWKLNDGETIESVLLKHPNHTTFCISSQVGCQLGCTFCATGASGFRRNLTTGEIVGQIIFMEKQMGSDVSNVVFMGMGEPMMNQENVIKSVKILNDSKGRMLGIRHFTVSTAGVVPGIIKLADSGMDIKLSVSLHSANNEKRSSIMPVNRLYSLTELIHSLKYYQKRTGNRVTFEYTLIKDFNYSRRDVLDLKNLLKGLKSFINVIPVNPVNSPHTKPTRKETNEFIKELTAEGIEAALRIERGKDIDAACGQLRRRQLGGKEN